MGKTLKSRETSKYFIESTFNRTDSHSKKRFVSYYKISSLWFLSDEIEIRKTLESLGNVFGVYCDVENSSIAVEHEGDNKIISHNLYNLGMQVIYSKKVECRDEVNKLSRYFAQCRKHDCFKITLVVLVMLMANLIALISGFTYNSTGVIAVSLMIILRLFFSLVSNYYIKDTITTVYSLEKLKRLLSVSAGFTVILAGIIHTLDNKSIDPLIVMVFSFTLFFVNIFCFFTLFSLNENNLKSANVSIVVFSDLVYCLSVLGGGALVAITESIYPDLIVGITIAVLFMKSSVRQTI